MEFREFESGVNLQLEQQRKHEGRFQGHWPEKEQSKGMGEQRAVFCFAGRGKLWVPSPARKAEAPQCTLLAFAAITRSLSNVFFPDPLLLTTAHHDTEKLVYRHLRSLPGWEQRDVK